MIDLLTLRAFEKAIREDIPDFRVAFKDQSTFMKVLGFLMYPINAAFMERFTTTIGSTVYFPTEALYVSQPEKRLRTLAHEYVHLWDAKQRGIWFSLSYLFPQILMVIPLVVFGVLAWPHTWLLALLFGGYLLGALVAKLWRPAFWIVFGLAAAGMLVGSVMLTGWTTLALGAALLCLGPWPAPWRTKWELRGYGMNVAVAWWVYSSYKPAFKEHIVTQFVGANYFFMCWSRSKVESRLDLTHASARAGTLQGLPPYRLVHEFLYQRNLLRH